MTCIVGVRIDGGVIIGGDSAGVAGYSVTVRRDPKVFALGPLVVGYTTSFRFGQLLRFGSDPPALVPGMPDFEWMVRRFIPWLSETLASWKKTENGRDEGGTALVGLGGSLFEVESDFQVGESVVPYSAVGCGDEYAMGAMHAASAAGVSGAALARAGLEAANAFSAGVAAPFTFLQSREDLTPSELVRKLVVSEVASGG